MTKNKIYQVEDGGLYLSGGYYVYYDWRNIGDPAWHYTSSGEANTISTPYEFQQANTNIYTDATLTTVVFAQTAESAVTILWNRVRSARHKGAEFNRVKSAKHKDGEIWKRVNL